MLQTLEWVIGVKIHRLIDEISLWSLIFMSGMGGKFLSFFFFFDLGRPFILENNTPCLNDPMGINCSWNKIKEPELKEGIQNIIAKF